MRQDKKEIYFSLDVETDGPIPGPHSMLSFSTVVFDPERPKSPVAACYSTNLALLPGATADPDTQAFWAKNQEAYERTRVNPLAPEVAMPTFVEWVKGQARALGATPVCACYPATFDFMFLYWYMIRFAKESPFGFQALDMKSLAMAALGGGFKAASKRNFPRSWFVKAGAHTHVAEEDAREQGHMLMAILADLEQFRSAIKR